MALPRSVGESGFDGGTGVQGSQHGDRGNRGASEFGRHVWGDGGKAQNIDVQHFTGPPRRIEILAAVVPKPEVQTLSDRGLLDHVGMIPWFAKLWKAFVSVRTRVFGVFRPGSTERVLDRQSASK